MLHTITYRVTKPYNLDDLGVYFLRIHFSLHLTLLFFMDVIIFFGNLDGSRSLSCFTCGSYKLNLFRQSRRLSVSTSFRLFGSLKIIYHAVSRRLQFVHINCPQLSQTFGQDRCFRLLFSHVGLIKL